MATSKSTDSIDKRSVEGAFRDALSSIPLRNCVIKAYHTVNMHGFVPPYRLRWQIPAIFVPTRVRQAVDTKSVKSVVANMKLEITQARKAIEVAYSVLNREVEYVVHHTPDRPFNHLHASVTVAHRTPPGYASAWSYTYNPYLLAVAILNEYEQFIDIVMRRRRHTPFTKLTCIHQKAKMLENNTRLVMHAMERDGFGW